MLGEVARALAVFLAGYGAGLVSMAMWYGRGQRPVSLNRVLAVAILVVVTGGSLLGVWNSYQMRSQAQCQADVNGAFLSALKTNTDAAEQDRDNLDSTVERLVSRSDGDSSEDILRDYLAERERADGQREAYPALPEHTCG